MNPTDDITEIRAELAELRARLDAHCTPAKPCPTCAKSKSLANQAELFASIAREATRREALDRQAKIDAATKSPRIKITPRGRVYLQLPDERQGRVLSIALDSSGRDGGRAMFPLLSSWQRALVELPELAKLVAAGELVAQAASMPEQVSAPTTNHLDAWAAAL